MKIAGNVAGAMARLVRGSQVSSPRTALEQPRFGRDLSQPATLRLEYSLATVAKLITPPRPPANGTDPVDYPINEDSLADHVRAMLGMAHNESLISPLLRLHLDELSKNSATLFAQPVTLSSFTLLCALYLAYQIPGTPEYGSLSRASFLKWLDTQLGGRGIREDLIPETYFGNVRTEPVHEGRCTLWYVRPGATPVDIQPMRRLKLSGVHLAGADLHDADLNGADLSNANLHKANLTGADLTNADMTAAHLSGANLQQANLKNANLTNAKMADCNLLSANLQDTIMQGIELQSANLQSANLRFKCLESTNLQGANLQDADLTGANLQQARLQGANLQGANLEDTNLTGANLQHAQLQADRQGNYVRVDADPLNAADLQYADRRHSNLRVARLHRANLRGVNLQNANLENANLENADLRDANLKKTKLENVTLTNARLERANLSRANLKNAKLANVTLDSANLGFASLRGADLQYPDLQGAHLYDTDLTDAQIKCAALVSWEIIFSDALMSGTKLIIDPAPKDGELEGCLNARIKNPSHFFDVYLNHRNRNNGAGGGGVLKAITGLHDSCGDTKRALMRAVVGELDRARTTDHDAVAALIPSLGDVLFEDPAYLEGHDGFARWLCDGLLGDGSMLLDPTLCDSALLAVQCHAQKLLREDPAAASLHGMAIFQVLYALRQRAETASSNDAKQAWQTRSRELHELCIGTLKNTVPSLVDKGSVFHHERDGVLYDDDAFPLVSANGLHCVVMTDQYFRQLVLGKHVPGEAAWENLRCVSRDSPEAPFPVWVPEPDHDASRRRLQAQRGVSGVLDRFPLLRSARQREVASRQMAKMLGRVGLTDTLTQRFTNALQRRQLKEEDEKLVTDDAQLELGGIFERLYEQRDDQSVHLKPVHLDDLQAQWSNETPEAFAFRLLCIAAVYTNYASSYIFGKELESPNALRHYAEALLRAVHAQDSGLLPTAKLDDWVARLRGKGNAFTCSSVLYSIQSTHIETAVEQERDRGLLRQVRDEMLPLVWRR